MLILAVNPVEFLGFYPPPISVLEVLRNTGGGVKPQNPLSAKMLRNKGLGGMKPKEITKIRISEDIEVVDPPPFSN